MDDILKEFNENGYVLIDNVLTEKECESYVKMLERDNEKYSPYYVGSTNTEHGLNNKSEEKVVYNMHNKDIKYFDLFDHPKVLPVVNKLLKEGSYQESESVNLLNISARSPKPYADAQQLHLDSNLPGKNSYPIIVVALFMLNDFTEKNGSTRLVPGSHKFDHYAVDGRQYDNEIRLVEKKGTVLLFNGSLWHGSSKKYDDETRWAVILGYGRWFIKPSFDFSRNIPADIAEQLSEKRLRLLGVDSNPPIDEFTRITRRTTELEWDKGYELPG